MEQRSLHGRYRKGRKLGAGAFGTVYKAIDRLTGQFVAMKEVACGHDPATDAEVRRELELLQVLCHKNIVRYLDTEVSRHRGAGPPKLRIYLEYVEGGSIASVLGQFGALSEPVIRNYSGQALQGLGYLHENGVLHLDVKPANMLVSAYGDVKLADFGTSQRVVQSSSALAVEESGRARAAAGPQPAQEEEGGASTGVATGIVGSPAYIAPEAIRGELDFAADVWSLGASVVEIATGKQPWEGALEYGSMMEFLLKVSKMDVRPAVPARTPRGGLSEQCQDFVDRMLQRTVSERATTASLLSHPFLTTHGDDDYKWDTDDDDDDSGEEAGAAAAGGGGGGFDPDAMFRTQCLDDSDDDDDVAPPPTALAATASAQQPSPKKHRDSSAGIGVGEAAPAASAGGGGAERPLRLLAVDTADGGAHPQRSPRAIQLADFRAGVRVVHVGENSRGEGQVVHIGKDGLRVRYDSGDEHTYKQRSLRKLRPLPPAPDKSTLQSDRSTSISDGAGADMLSGVFLAAHCCDDPSSALLHAPQRPPSAGARAAAAGAGAGGLRCEGTPDGLVTLGIAFSAADFAAGDRVEHTNRGPGVVTSVDVAEGVVRVKFDRVGAGEHRYREASLRRGKVRPASVVELARTASSASAAAAAAAAAGGGAPPEPLVGGDRSMKFDMYFAEHTAPATLFTRIGNPLVATLGAGRSASLTCCGLPRSGKTGSVVGAHPDPGNDMSLGLFPLVVRDLFNRHGATHCIRVARLLPPLRGRAGLWDAIKDRAVVADRCAAWAQLRNEVMHPAGDWDEAQHMLSVPQLAFAGVTAPVQCAVELSPKRRGSNRDGLPYRQLSIHGEHVVSPDAPTLFVTLLYSDMEWEGWVAAAAQLVRAHRRPAAAADAEAAAAAHPLLSSVREVLREEGALHYLLHSFHARRAEQGDVIRSLAALSEAARPAAPTPAPGATPAERRMSARGSPTPLGLDPGRRAPVRER